LSAFQHAPALRPSLVSQGSYTLQAEMLAERVRPLCKQKGRSVPAGMMPPRCFQVRLLVQHVSPENVAWWKSIIAPQDRPDRTASFTAGTTSPAKTSTCRSWSPEGQKMKVSIPCSRANPVSVSTQVDGGPSRGLSSTAPMLPETLYARRISCGYLPALSAPSSILRCISGSRPGGE
jgi:hypothetical protein